MGESHVRLFAEEGATVVLSGVRDRLGERSAATLVREGHRAAYVSLSSLIAMIVAASMQGRVSEDARGDRGERGSEHGDDQETQRDHRGHAAHPPDVVQP